MVAEGLKSFDHPGCCVFIPWVDHSDDRPMVRAMTLVALDCQRVFAVLVSWWGGGLGNSPRTGTIFNTVLDPWPAPDLLFLMADAEEVLGIWV